MKVLVTGGAGFIGSHLTETYLGRGDEVYILDDLTTGSLDNIRHLTVDPRFKDRLHVKIDTVLNRDVLLELVGTCDLIFHLAAAVGVKYIIDNPLSSIMTNVTGTERVLELACKFKKRFFLASTSEVYGKQNKAPLNENDSLVLGSTTIGRWSYACGKALDEFLALAYHKEKRLPVTIFRFFNTVGPRQKGNYGMVLPRFIRQALHNQPITVYGSGEQTRTFAHVADVVGAMVKLAAHPETVGEVFNLGGNEEISINNLAKRVRELTQSTSEIKNIDYSEAYEKDFEDMPRRVPDISKANRFIGYQPSFTLNQIIQSIVEFESR